MLTKKEILTNPLTNARGCSTLVTVEQIGQNQMNFKLVYCEVREGSLVSQQPPFPDSNWVEVPDSRQTAGKYYQATFAARLPEKDCENLPDYCTVDERFDYVTKVNSTTHFGKKVIEVCFQEAPGHRIESFIL